jgi:Bacterial SH3 domain
MNSTASLLIASLVAATLLVDGRAQAADLHEVEQEHTFVYEQPDPQSPVLRRLYLGELVDVVSSVHAADGSDWVKVSFGPQREGFVRSNHLVKAGSLPRERWQPTRIARDERPFGCAGAFWGETFGAMFKLRYLLFTRLGIALGSGMVWENPGLSGRSLSLGIVSHLALHNLSPVVEVGAISFSRDSGDRTLNLLGIYTNIGLEWIFNWGLFLSAGMSFMRSIDISVAVNWENRNTTVNTDGTFGRLERHIKGNILYAVEPTWSIGYSF